MIVREHQIGHLRATMVRSGIGEYTEIRRVGASPIITTAWNETHELIWMLVDATKPEKEEE